MSDETVRLEHDATPTGRVLVIPSYALALHFAAIGRDPRRPRVASGNPKRTGAGAPPKETT